jgi:hypothetical protein
VSFELRLRGVIGGFAVREVAQPNGSYAAGTDLQTITAKGSVLGAGTSSTATDTIIDPTTVQPSPNKQIPVARISPSALKTPVRSPAAGRWWEPGETMAKRR